MKYIKAVFNVYFSSPITF